MHIFDYENALAPLLSPEIMSLVAEIHEYKGKQDYLLSAKADVLSALVEVAREKSVESSNRIVGISTPEYRLRDLFDENAEPRDDAERALCAYRDCFDAIVANADSMPPTPETILDLHRRLFAWTPSGGGAWRSEDADIVRIDGDGRDTALIKPIPAAETPLAMELLCDAYGKAAAQGRFNPLLLAVAFVFDFLCVHPFQDGNGRMGRLLLLLLTCRSGYVAGKHVSVDKMIDESRQWYFDALRTGSRGWHENANDIRPFATHILGAVLAAYREFAARLDGLVHEHTSKFDRIRNTIAATDGTISKREIQEKCPDIKTITIAVALKRLCDEGFICKTGNGRNAAYIRVE